MKFLPLAKLSLVTVADERRKAGGGGVISQPTPILTLPHMGEKKKAPYQNYKSYPQPNRSPETTTTPSPHFGQF